MARNNYGVASLGAHFLVMWIKARLTMIKLKYLQCICCQVNTCSIESGGYDISRHHDRSLAFRGNLVKEARGNTGQRAV